MITHNSSLITSGLIFSYDQLNLKSYVGPPLKNFLTGITQQGISDNPGAGYRVFSGTEDVFIPSVGHITGCKFVDSYNDYSLSGNCCPSFYTYGNGITISNSTLYTYGILYRSVNRYTHPNYMYHYEFNSSGGYLTEFGVHNTGTETHLGNGWYWSRAKFTSQTTAASINTGLWMYQYSTWNRIYIAKAVLLQGDYTGLHPKYWPDNNTTRSTSQSLFDLIGNSSLTIQSLTYNSDGIFSFNGSSDYITSASTIFDKVNGQEITVSCWIKTETMTSKYRVFCTNRSSGGTYNWIFYQHATDGAIGFHGSAQNKSSYIPTPNTWIHVTNTVATNGVSTLYVNGVATYTVTGYTYGSVAGTLGIGGYPGGTNEYYQGSISQVQIYDRALSATEVKQLFNASRGRYGL